MTGQQLAAVLEARTTLDRGQARTVVQTIFGALRAGLVAGERIELRGLGTFYGRWQKERQGVHPQTGLPNSTPGKRIPAFRPAEQLRALARALGAPTA